MDRDEAERDPAVSKGKPGQPVKDIRLAWAACAKAGT